MAHLLVRLHGERFATLSLQEGQEYLIGRGSECAIVLTAQRGISRQHLKLFQNEGVWIAQSLSRFVPLQRDGQRQETIELKKKITFFAPPFEFSFDPSDEVQADAPPSNTALARIPEGSRRTPAPRSPSQEPRGNLELTVAGDIVLAPFLRILYHNSDQQEVLRLEGDNWMAGRETASEIPLRDSRVSRRHFELSRSREGFLSPTSEVRTEHGSTLKDSIRTNRPGSKAAT